MLIPVPTNCQQLGTRSKTAPENVLSLTHGALSEKEYLPFEWCFRTWLVSSVTWELHRCGLFAVDAFADPLRTSSFQSVDHEISYDSRLCCHSRCEPEYPERVWITKRIRKLVGAWSKRIASQDRTPRREFEVSSVIEFASLKKSMNLSVLSSELFVQECFVK